MYPAEYQSFGVMSSAVNPDRIVMVGDSDRKTLSAEKLLEAGASAHIIARCRSPATALTFARKTATPVPLKPRNASPM